MEFKLEGFVERHDLIVTFRSEFARIFVEAGFAGGDCQRKRIAGFCAKTYASDPFSRVLTHIFPRLLTLPHIGAGGREYRV
jgi:hypothetical protein